MKKVTVNNLTKIFGKKSQIDQALQLVNQNKDKKEILATTGATVGVYNANFDVNEGEIFVIMGLSGSGKSTLIRLLNRLIEPTAGDIYIDDENVSTMNEEALREVRRKKINMVFQNFALFPHKTILENTEYGMEIRDIDKDERRQRAEKALDNAGLLAFKDQFPNQLSGGMQQRVGLARALANNPDILLMDEAFSALDPLIRREMQNELLELQKEEKRTIIFITHDLDEALRLGDRIAVMKDGHIVQIGTAEEILTNPANDYVRDFVEEVDRSKVLTAQNIMIPALMVNAERVGPKTTQAQMKHDDIRYLLATNTNRELLGYLSMEDTITARKTGQKMADLVNPNVITVSPDTLVKDMFALGDGTPAPVTVVDDENKILGVVRRGTILDALAKVNDTTEEVVNV